MVGRRLVEERHTVDVLRDGLTSLASAPLFTIEMTITTESMPGMTADRP
jgi:hypothetical protein